MKQIVDHDLGFVVEGKVTKRNSKVSQTVKLICYIAARIHYIQFFF